MNTFSKIAGILLTGAILFGIASCFIAMFFSGDDTETKAYIGLALIAGVIFLYFLYLHKFGFKLNTENTKYSKVSLMFLGVSALILALLPTWYLLEEIKIERHSEKTLDLGESTACNNFTGSLKTKYSKGNIKYVLNLKRITESSIKGSSFFVVLKDEDGFKLGGFEPSEYSSYEIDTVAGTLESLMFNSEHEMLLEDYIKIKQWDLLCNPNKSTE